MTDQPDLRETVHAATKGDDGAVDALLVRFLPDVQRYLANQAGQLVKAKESSSDLAQSVCREVLQQIGDGRFEFRGEAEFKQWLYQAAEHKILNRHRFYKAGRRDGAREARDAPAGDSEAGAPDVAETQSTPSMHAMRGEDRAALEANLKKLPERQSDVVRRFHFQQQTHREIAEALDIEESHSRVLLARGMAKLARLGITQDKPD